MDPKKKADNRPERSFASGRIEIKKAAGAEAAAGAGTFTGFGIRFNEPHPTSSWMLPQDWMDVVKPGAFSKTLEQHARRGSRPAMLWMHDMYDPIGVWDSIQETKEGLVTDGSLCIDVEEIADRYKLMRQGAVAGESIGFIPTVVELDEKARERSILEVDLFEISVVTVPGDAGALIGDVKSYDPTNIRDWEARLRDVGKLSSTEAKRLLAGGFKALAGQRDADDGILQALLQWKK
jgi:HK97 family phage prohead protease